MAKFHWDVQQGSLAWHQLRSGIPTASNFHLIITPKTKKMSQSRWKYACRLIAERLLNWQPDSIDHLKVIEAGKENEPLAIKSFEFITNTVTRPVGFVTTNDGRFGASPDRVLDCGGIGDPPPTSVSRIAEVKGPTIPIQMERLLSPHILEMDPSANVHGGADYICQVQGQLFVSEAEKDLFYSFAPRMPDFMQETTRDEVFIRSLIPALEQFSDELEALHHFAKQAGGYEAFASLVTPTDATFNAEQLAGIIEGETEMRGWGG